VRKLLLLLPLLMSGCAVGNHVQDNWYVKTGPMLEIADEGDETLDNSDIPWRIEAGVKVGKRCATGYSHLSSFKGGYPLWIGGADDLTIDAMFFECGIGPGL